MKTRLELLLDSVSAEHEVTIDVRDYTPAQKDLIERAANARGLNASSDGKYILIRQF